MNSSGIIGLLHNPKKAHRLKFLLTVDETKEKTKVSPPKSFLDYCSLLLCATARAAYPPEYAFGYWLVKVWYTASPGAIGAYV